jgi:predicted nuclease of predicted toxin-antitoxin system
MSRAKRRARPALCIDENLSPTVAGVFRDIGFRVFEVSKDPHLRGRDEREYSAELYRRNAIFVTADFEYVDEAAGARTRHAGITLIPQQMTDSEKSLLSLVTAHFILGYCSKSSTAFRNRILYAAHDGLRLIHRGENELVASYPRLREHISSDETREQRLSRLARVAGERSR